VPTGLFASLNQANAIANAKNHHMRMQRPYIAKHIRNRKVAESKAWDMLGRLFTVYHSTSPPFHHSHIAHQHIHLSHFFTFLHHYSTSSLLHHSTPPPLHPSTTPSLLRLFTSLYPSTSPPLYHSTSPPLHHSTPPLHQHIRRLVSRTTQSVDSSC
jgi:hypothetical protein